MTVPWEDRIADIVDGWLFDEDVELPTVLLVPLENPHLFDVAGWSVLGPVRDRSGVVAVHEYQGTRIGVAKPVLGAAGCAMLVDAASRRGVRTVLGVGYCGGTAPALRSGDVVAAISAVTGDGVSTRYLPGQDLVPASTRLVGTLDTLAAGSLTTGESQLHLGPVHSVGAVHLETQALIDECTAAGVLGVDMETASLYAVAQARDMAALTLLVVSDVPARGLAADVTRLGAGTRMAVSLACALALDTAAAEVSP